MRKIKLLLYLFLFPFLIKSQITINFCPVSKTQALPKGFSSTISITNNTGQILDLANNNFNMDWPSLITLPWPFSDGIQTGINWGFKLNLDWPGTLSVGSTKEVEVKDAKFSGVLQFPTSGLYTQDGTTYNVVVNHCNQTDAFELYDKSFDFDRECFIYSPTSNMCLGEAASEIWDGEGIFDAAVPKDRPSWGIGVMVAHRLFTNLTKLDMVSPNFWTATALNESRMTCDPTIVPDVKNHWGINTQPNLGTGIDNRTDNCFQVLNIGYVQLENNQPDLFAQTNSFGTANFASVIGGGKWETGALAVTYYHYQNIQYWNQIKCLNLLQVDKDSKDPYATEKVLYHAFHDGFNSGTTLIEDIKVNYNNAINANNMNDVIGTGGTWANLGGGSSQKVANFTSLLDNKGVYPYPTQATDLTTEYYGCYDESIKWSDIEYYLEQVKILYPQLIDIDIKSEIESVFSSINGGGDVLFSNLGPVIDEIVIQMGGHDPSSYLATQYSASKDCPQNPVGVSLRTNDTLCPGENGFLQVWLSGDPNFEVDIKFPDNTIKKYTNITSSPYNIEINQPGVYEVVYFEDIDEIGDINCNFAKITVESKNGSIVNWDKTNFDVSRNCSNGDLIIEKLGDEEIIINYTKDGIDQTPVVIKSNEDSKTILSNVQEGTYIITGITPNNCEVDINDTITFCSDCIKPYYSILTPDTLICKGDTGFIRFSFNGVSPYIINYKLNGVLQDPMVVEFLDKARIPILESTVIEISSVEDDNCKNDTSKDVSISVNPLIDIDLGNDTILCDTSTLTLDVGMLISKSYLWNTGEKTTSIDVLNSGDYWIKLTNDGCSSSDTINVEIEKCVLETFDSDTFYVCKGDTLTIQANNITNEEWSGDEFTKLNDSTIIVNPTKNISKYYLGNEDGLIKGENVIINGDFENGNEGITTEYIEKCVRTLNEGRYCVGPNPKAVHNGFSPCGDHTTGNGNMFIANGASILNHKIWCQTVNTDINTDYEFSAWLSDVVGSSPPIFQFQVDGVLLGGTLNVTEPKCTWQQYDAIWESGTKTSVEICLINQNTAGGGNDFAIDDIEFVPIHVNVSKQDSIVVILVDPKELNIGNDTTVCYGDSITLDAGVNDSYIWSTNETTQKINVKNTDEYSVDVIDDNGCKSSDSINLTIKDLPMVNIGNDTIICYGDSITLDVNNIGLNYIWSNGETTQKITIKTNSDYWVRVTDDIGCYSNDTINLLVNNLPLIDLGNDTIVCLGDSLLLTANDNFRYIWSTNEITQSIMISDNGLYSVTVYDDIDCESTDDINIELDSIEDIFVEREKLVCLNDTITLRPDNFNDYDISWSGVKDSIKVNSSGVYISTVSNENCSKDFEISVESIDTPDVYIFNKYGKNVFCFDYETPELEIKGDDVSNVWYPVVVRESTIVIDSPGDYTVYSSGDNCTSVNKIEITEYCDKQIFIPNSFTPNGDGNNETFIPILNNIVDYELRIFNRWGDMIFLSRNVNKGWNGIYMGSECQVDVYVYKISYKYLSKFGSNRTDNIIGRVSLIR
jgi:gliding motility-associated-like protein